MTTSEQSHKFMTTAQADQLRGYLDMIDAQVSPTYVEQIHFLAGGNISQSTLTVVSVQQDPGNKKFYRYCDIFDHEGRTDTTTTTEVNPESYGLAVADDAIGRCQHGAIKAYCTHEDCAKEQA